MLEQETRKLYEVKDEIYIGCDECGQDIVLEVGTRIWIYDHPSYEWPRWNGFDISFDKEEFDKFFELIKVDEEWY